jgi:membrane protease YdiL (CAAX protease family)
MRMARARLLRRLHHPFDHVVSVGDACGVIPAVERAIGGTFADLSVARKIGSFFITTIINVSCVLGTSALCARLLERRGLGSVGYKFHPGWWRDFGLGLILGAVTLAVSVGVIFLAGAASFRTHTTDVAILAPGFAALFILLLLAAAYEELLIRGFAFQALAHNVGPAVALAVTSVGFGLLHLGNQGATVFSTVNTTLAGVWLGTAYWMTRSLWLATALHVSWNFAMALIFGLNISGITDFVPFAWLVGQPGSPTWLSGGNYGPEGGAAATLGLLLSTLLIWKSGLWTASAEMLAALRHGSQNRRSAGQAQLEDNSTDFKLNS